MFGFIIGCLIAAFMGYYGSWLSHRYNARRWEAMLRELGRSGHNPH